MIIMVKFDSFVKIAPPLFVEVNVVVRLVIVNLWRQLSILAFITATLTHATFPACDTGVPRSQENAHTLGPPLQL